MKTLLIYSMMPECVKVYAIPNDVLNDDQRAVLDACNGKVVNIDEHIPEMTLLSDALAKEDGHCDMETPEEWRCNWSQYEVNVSEGERVEGLVDIVYYSGFAY